MFMAGNELPRLTGPELKCYSLVVLLSICKGGELREEFQSDRNKAKIVNAGIPIP